MAPLAPPLDPQLILVLADTVILNIFIHFITTSLLWFYQAEIRFLDKYTEYMK